MKIPKAKPIVVPMPREHNYRIGEGRYGSLVHKVVRTGRQNCQGGDEVLRIVFAVNVPGKERFLNLAKAEFALNLEHGSELRNFLVRLIGKESLAALSGQEINFETLVGKPVDVEIEHIITSKRDQYDYPFVRVCDIQPAGTFVKVVEAKPVEKQNDEQTPKEPVEGGAITR